MIVDGFCSDIYIHINCLNSKEGKRWREDRAKSDELYRGYLELITHGREVNCPACRTRCKLYSKSRDVGYVWELCCDQCGEVSLNGLSAYTSEDDVHLLEELKSLEASYFRTKDEAIQVRMEAISALRGTFGRCACGGQFVIAAYPRCSNCFTPLLDSYFHYSNCY